MKTRIPLKWLRYWQIIKYGWKDAEEISKMPDVKMSRWAIFKDIFFCFKKFYLFSNIYKEHRVWELNEDEKKEFAETIGEKYRKRDDFFKVYYSNWKFLNKYTKIKYLQNRYLESKHNRAYAKHYGLSDDIYVQYGVTIICEHFHVGRIKIGKKVLLARNVDIDYTGDITIGNGVGILEGVKILTHGHDYLMMKKEKDILPFSKRTYLSPLVISDGVTIGTHSIIMPGVHYIGKNSFISAGSVVTKRVPDNVIVAGNPAVVVGSIEGMNIYQRYEEK